MYLLKEEEEEEEPNRDNLAVSQRNIYPSVNGCLTGGKCLRVSVSLNQELTEGTT